MVDDWNTGYVDTSERISTDRPDCDNCGKPCEMGKKDKVSLKVWWRDKCQACHNVRTDQIALAKLAVGNKLQFLNNENNMKKKEKKISASVNESGEQLFEELKKDFDISQPGAAWSNDLNNYGGVATKMMLRNFQKEQLKKKEENRLKINKKQKENREKKKAIDISAKALSWFEISAEMEIIEKSQKMREERKLQKNAVATGTLEEAVGING